MIAEDIYEKNGTKNLKELQGSQISLDTFFLLLFLLMNLGGLFPFSLYILKDNLSLPYFLEVNIFIFGMYFYKLLNTFNVNKKKFEYQYWYMFIFVILNVVYITYYFKITPFDLPILKILTEYLLFAAGILSFLFLRKKVSLPSIDIYSFENSFIYQISFLLFALLMEI
jgi:multicomponent Na+:H+ antiporter subunit D